MVIRYMRFENILKSHKLLQIPIENSTGRLLFDYFIASGHNFTINDKITFPCHLFDSSLYLGYIDPVEFTQNFDNTEYAIKNVYVDTSEVLNNDLTGIILFSPIDQLTLISDCIQEVFADYIKEIVIVDTLDDTIKSVFHGYKRDKPFKENITLFEKFKQVHRSLSKDKKVAIDDHGGRVFICAKRKELSYLIVHNGDMIECIFKLKVKEMT